MNGKQNGAGADILLGTHKKLELEGNKVDQKDSGCGVMICAVT